MTDDEESGWAKIRFTQPIDDLIKYVPSIKVGVVALPIDGTERMTVVALIDTGAAGTAISPRLARVLNREPIGFGTAHEAGREPITVPYFKIRLYLFSAEIELEVAGLPSLDPPHDILIGRDILADCRLVVDFISGSTSLHIKSNL
jgi:predicted aspartyl protease